MGGLIDAAAPREVVLIGHDWGAVVAWFAAIRRVRPLDRLVIMNVPHPGVDLASGRLRQLFRSWYILFFQLPMLPELLLRAGNYRLIAAAFRSMAISSRHRDVTPLAGLIADGSLAVDIGSYTASRISQTRSNSVLLLKQM